VEHSWEGRTKREVSDMKKNVKISGWDARRKRDGVPILFKRGSIGYDAMYEFESDNDNDNPQVD
jgi:hypothetical protein